MMNEIQYAQTVADQQEWEHEQEQRRLMDAEDARKAMQEERLERDRQKLLNIIGFDDVFKGKK